MPASISNPQSPRPLSSTIPTNPSTPTIATATCYCTAVQLSFPTSGPDLLSTFLCHCTDCRKITASMFASNFTIADTHLTHVRGAEHLKTYSQSHTTTSGKAMTNYFCEVCGTLMYRVGEAFPGRRFLRLGTVDDLGFCERELRPVREIYVKDRVAWCREVEGMVQMGGKTVGS